MINLHHFIREDQPVDVYLADPSAYYLVEIVIVLFFNRVNPMCGRYIFRVDMRRKKLSQALTSALKIFPESQYIECERVMALIRASLTYSTHLCYLQSHLLCDELFDEILVFFIFDYLF